ncbi:MULTISPECIES: ferritin-like domain-containing protein [Sphingomonas]|uniref:Ferritin-like domain-containing protein n=1 Tax=Sphingomonas kyungheensis TaxID=1069987 RepID=A0ABU8H4W3_9SPHN|nr:ferritin-like domain-containing protein [Sphingomonas sp. CV7422]
MTDLPTDTILDAIADRRAERRNFLRYAGGAAASAGALSLLAACGGDSGSGTPTPTPTATTPTLAADADVLNFALNLEYLEASFYSWAAFGQGLTSGIVSGVGTLGSVTGGALVPFQDPIVAQYAREIANDEVAHVTFLRSILSSSAVAMPAINISGDANGAFTAAARAAGVIGSSDVFNPYADDISFLLGAYLFEDVGVSAYKGASPLIVNKVFLEAAAGILATEGYHAGLIRSVLYRKGVDPAETLAGASTILANTQKISDARDSLDGSSDDDQGIGDTTTANVVPTDSNGVAYSRSTGQVLNIVYLNKTAVGSGGFFPAGLNGNIRTSAASG